MNCVEANGDAVSIPQHSTKLGLKYSIAQFPHQSCLLYKLVNRDSAQARKGPARLTGPL